MSRHPAARVTDHFGHSAAWEGLAAGIAVGALIAVATVATGGLGAVAIGAALAATGAAGLAGAAIGQMFDGPDTGQLEVGSRDVKANGLAATMVTLATGHCSHHGPSALLVASGSATVRINGQPAARITDTMDCEAVIRTGSPNVNIGGPTQSPVCSALRGEATKFAQFAIDAAAAEAAYSPPATRVAPPGYHNATPADLAKLRLSEAMLEHPIDPKTGQPSEFRAAVFTNDATGAPLVAFKGTTPTSRQDWTTNVGQGRGQETFYYDQAQKISTNVAEAPNGAGTDGRLTGHSLGGGMASAGAEASGLPATTFNAAGLDAHTVPHPVPANIDAVYVQGEVLHGVNSLPGAPAAAATRTWPLAPIDYRNQALTGAADGLAAAGPLGAMIAGGALATRAVSLHMMSAVDSAMAARRAEVGRALVANGCP